MCSLKELQQEGTMLSGSFNLAASTAFNLDLLNNFTDICTACCTTLYLADANDMEQGPPLPGQNRIICAVPACRSTAHVVRAPPSCKAAGLTSDLSIYQRGARA